MDYTLLLDVDHCLAPFNQDAGTEKVKQLLKEALGERGLLIGDLFGRIFYDFDSIHHGNQDPKLFSLRDRINSYKVMVPNELSGKHVNFMWSRELWLKYLSDQHALSLDGETIIRIIDAYWEAISSASQVHPEALDYLRKLDKEKLFIITSSDKRLAFESDTWEYDPQISQQKKSIRVQNQGLRKVFPASHVITGDPIDKPSQEFWEKVMEITGLSKPSQGIVVDDSLAVVLSGKGFGFRGYLLDRKKFYKRVDVQDKVDGYITELNQLSEHIE